MALNLKKLVSPVLAASLLLPSVNALAGADPFEDDKPSALSMYTDLLVIRPFGIAVTAVGAVAYVVSLPFTLPVGGATEAGKVLVAEPALYTFARCLGCTRTGYNKGVVDAEEAEAEAIETAGEGEQK